MLTIEDLIYPILLNDFLNNHWGSSASYIPGDPNKFHKLVTLSSFKELIHNANSSDVNIRAVFKKNNSDSSFKISPLEMESAYEAGATICVSQLDKLSSSLKMLCDQTKLHLGYLGGIHVNAYWSPAGAGFRPHFDARYIMTLQIDGSKVWRYGNKPTLDWPSNNAKIVGNEIIYPHSNFMEWELDGELEPLPEWNEVLLKPGDVLCLPAGTPHMAEATGHSFALNFHFNSIDAGAIVGKLISNSLSHKNQWRHIPPLLGDQGLHTGANNRGLTFLSERIDEAISLLTQMRENQEELLCQSIALNMNDVPIQKKIDPQNKFIELPKQDRCKNSTTLSPSTSIAVLNSLIEKKVVVLLEAEKVELTDSALEIFRYVVINKKVQIESLDIKGLTSHQILKIVEELVTIGLLIYDID